MWAPADPERKIYLDAARTHLRPHAYPSTSNEAGLNKTALDQKSRKTSYGQQAVTYALAR